MKGGLYLYTKRERRITREREREKKKKKCEVEEREGKRGTMEVKFICDLDFVTPKMGKFSRVFSFQVKVQLLQKSSLITAIILYRALISFFEIKVD